MSTWSLGETEALARKAARGAGYSWGEAEETGQAVRLLHRFGMDGSAALADLLIRRDSSPQITCPVTAGIALLDGGSAPNPSQSIVTAPVLLVPFVLWHACKTNTPCRLDWRDTTLSTETDGTLLVECLNFDAAACAVTVTQAESCIGWSAHPDRTRATLQDRVIARLNDYAAKTYAPSTEASRQAGAGAGLTDND